MFYKTKVHNQQCINELTKANTCASCINESQYVTVTLIPSANYTDTR